jgi:ribosome biogenesis protein ERB1
MDHIGYDLAGKRIIKKKKKDGIDKFLDSQSDPLFHWTVRDEVNDEDIVLSRRDVEIIRQIHSGRFPHPEFDAFPDYIPWSSSEREIHPLIDAPEPKRRFLPSKWEKMKVMRLVRLIKEGKIRRGACGRGWLSAVGWPPRVVLGLPRARGEET